jgi:hypothetical protein
METRRVALVRYRGADGGSYVGSGLLVSDRTVLTAGHVADGFQHECSGVEWNRRVKTIERSQDSVVDVAVLRLAEPVEGVAPLGLARVDLTKVGHITNCVAVGFPRWKNGPPRLAAQVDGTVPTAEGLRSEADRGLAQGYLTLVGNRQPGTPAIPVGDHALDDAVPTSAWGGMSGAVVVSRDLAFGVVRSHNIAEGGQSLTITPLSAIFQLPAADAGRLWAALGVLDPFTLQVLQVDLADSAGERLVPDSGGSSRNAILVTRVLDPPHGEGVISTNVWLGASGRIPVIVDAVKVTHKPGPDLSMSTGALLPDATYSFAFQQGSSAVHALQPALALNPADEEEVWFTLGLAPDGTFTSTGGRVVVELQYHSLTGFHGVLPLREHHPSHSWLAALLNTDIEHEGCVLDADGVQIGYLSREDASAGVAFIALSEVVRPISEYAVECSGPLPPATAPFALPPARQRLNARIFELDAVHAICDELPEGRDWAYDLAAGLPDARCTTALIEQLDRRETFDLAMSALATRHHLSPDPTLADALLNIHEPTDIEALNWSQTGEPFLALATYPAGQWWAALLAFAQRDVHRAFLALYARRASLVDAQADALEELCWQNIATENPSIAALRYLIWRERPVNQIEDRLLARNRHLLPLVQD